MENDKSKRPSYLARLFAALFGQHPAPADFESSLPKPEPSELAARVAALQLELDERDARIATMRAEYQTLAQTKEQATSGAQREELERLFKRIAGTLANFAVLAANSDQGQAVEIGDLISLFRSLEKELARGGLEPIGRVGEQTSFDLATHQRMSGGVVHAGSPVTVQLPGYRLGERVLLKAMVSASEDAASKD